MLQNADDLTVIEGGKGYRSGKDHAPSGVAARTAGGLYITNSHQGVGIVWPQVLGVMPCGENTLVIIASFCLVTLHGPGVITLAKTILDRRISELHEGDEAEGMRIDTIMIESNLPRLGS